MNNGDEAPSQFRACPECGGKELGCEYAMPLADEEGNSAVRLTFRCTKCGLVWADIFRVERMAAADFSGDSFHTSTEKQKETSEGNLWEIVDKNLAILANIFTENSLVGIWPTDVVADLTFALKQIRQQSDKKSDAKGITVLEKPTKCRKCGSENIWRNYLCGGDTDTAYSVVCKSCGKHWKEAYRTHLVFIQDD